METANCRYRHYLETIFGVAIASPRASYYRHGMAYHELWRIQFRTPNRTGGFPPLPRAATLLCRFDVGDTVS